MVAKNWNYRFEKLQKCLKSWAPKFLPSLASRVEVLNVFALSRVYYVASILPINKTMIRKFESALGKFLWNSGGWLLRVAMDEVKNKRNKGGLGLVCIESMCSSLITSQFLRLLKSSDERSVAHVAYWIGDSLSYLSSDLETGSHATEIPDYFAAIEELFVLGRIDEIITPGTWRRITNKMLYHEKSKHFSVPKVELESGGSFQRVWQLINSSILTSSARDISFLLVHNKLPVPERLHRVGVKKDPYCDTCLGNQISNLEHFFCSCSKVVLVWLWIKPKLVSLIGEDIPDLKLIQYMFPKTDHDNEVVWLLGSYLEFVWVSIHVKKKPFLQSEQTFGFLKFKYKESNLGARYPLSNIPGFD